MPGNDSFTTLLLHMDGSDGSTTFTDSAVGGAAPHTVTPVGNAQIDTAQSKFGGAAGLFDGTGDYLTLDGSSDFAFGTGDFVVDFWLRFNAIAGAIQIHYDSRPSGGSGAYVGIFSFATTGALGFFDGTGVRITGTTSLSTGVWYHVALVRSSGTTRLFLDGVQEGSDFTDSNDYINGTSRPTIGTSGGSAGSVVLNGWIDELRVSVGTDRGWSGGFAPPAAAYSPAGVPRSQAVIVG
jgi:hypothetical protein